MRHDRFKEVKENGGCVKEKENGCKENVGVSNGEGVWLRARKHVVSDMESIKHNVQPVNCTACTVHVQISTKRIF